ncbi:hypothetical protein Ancab_017019 [Ancistrocladus abbreviatus]
MGEWRGGSWVWVFNWRRTLLQREEEWVRDLISCLSNSKPNREMVDGWKWGLSKTGVYTAKAAYEFLQGPLTPVVDKQLEFEVMTEDEVDSGHGFRTPEAFCTVLEETFVRSVFCGFAVGVRAIFVLWVDDQAIGVVSKRSEEVENERLSLYLNLLGHYDLINEKKLYVEKGVLHQGSQGVWQPNSVILVVLIQVTLNYMFLTDVHDN